MHFAEDTNYKFKQKISEGYLLKMLFMYWDLILTKIYYPKQ